jgi:phosphoribosylglycinamide formyltransferase-1
MMTAAGPFDSAGGTAPADLAVVVLISGRGSNLRAIVQSDPPCRIAAVVSNRPDAAGLEFARAHGIATEVVDHTVFATEDDPRAAFDAALMRTIDRHQPGLIVLAGFMRILTPAFVDHYRGRMINIHPSLLPAFAGLHTHRRALAEGVRLHGCTVHFVTAALDSGPIIVQAAVPVHPEDTEDALSARVLAQEHRLYPQAVRWFVQGRLSIAGTRVRLAPAAGAHAHAHAAGTALVVPPLD